MYNAKIVLDSLAPCGQRLTTWELTYPRFVHAELMTHRVFCLAGDAELEFDMPASQDDTRRVYKLTLEKFVHKWLHGSEPHRSRWGTQRTYDLKPRLKEMQIRQVNEATGEIQTAHVVNAIESGSKPVYEVRAGRYRIAGSEDHKVLTGNGWKTIKEIVIGDELIVSTMKRPNHLKTDPLRLKKIDGQWRSVWQRELRAQLISENPECRECGILEGTEVHHKEPVHANRDRAFDSTNITLLCPGCHRSMHAKQGWQTGNPLYAGTAVVDGIVYRGIEPTYDLEISGTFPNFLANKVVVHNSRNSASSRAIPVAKLIDRVKNDPVIPKEWGRNQAGMQAAGVLTESEAQLVEAQWLKGRDQALELSERLAQLGLHKQIANRPLESWMFITVLVTASSFSNWFRLRNHKDAQPEIRWLAKEMHEIYKSHVPTKLSYGDWHLPLLPDLRELLNGGYNFEKLKKISTGRVARISYLTHDGKRDPEEDIRLCDRLAESGHWSPFEHAAEALTKSAWQQRVQDALRWAELNGQLFNPMMLGNFVGWKQFRKEYGDEHGFNFNWEDM